MIYDQTKITQINAGRELKYLLLERKINVRVWKWKSKLGNPEKLAILGTQDTIHYDVLQ